MTLLLQSVPDMHQDLLMCLKVLCHCLNKHKYSYCTKRCKGRVITKNCRKHKKNFEHSHRYTQMSVVRSLDKLLVFILMGVSFTHKYNPIEEPCHCKSKAWGLCSEGLHRTGKEKKEGSGGRSASFLVGISYKKGLVIFTQYFKR